MKRVKFVLVALLLTITGLWLLTDTLIPDPFAYFSFRGVFVQYTGVIGMGAMSVAMMLALRPKRLEPFLGGLDKAYRLHKWLGITGLGFSVVHWWFAKGTKWMVGWGWLTRPARHPRGEQSLGAVLDWLNSQRGLAEFLGEWTFYVFVVLLIAALVKRFPYHLFTKTHKWLAVVYLILVFHSVVLTKFDYWRQPIGFVLAALLVGGVAAAVLALFGRIGASRKVQGTIASLTYYPELRVLESTVQLQEGWPGHEAGQFAFATSDKKEGAHPYTIASAWDPADRRIVFITKALGDHTGRLRERLKVGMPVTVEGPYGCFDFRDEQTRQIWIGAGIGITPFVARMKDLAKTPRKQSIDLFHPTADFEQAAIDRLTADAQSAGVRLHLLVSPREGRLDGERIRNAVPEWLSASIWFCGPPGFGQALKKDFVAHGLSPKRFHQELFQMR
jgi:predicted ferric reductase